METRQQRWLRTVVSTACCLTLLLCGLSKADDCSRGLTARSSRCYPSHGEPQYPCYRAGAPITINCTVQASNQNVSASEVYFDFTPSDASLPGRHIPATEIRGVSVWTHTIQAASLNDSGTYVCVSAGCSTNTTSLLGFIDITVGDVPEHPSSVTCISQSFKNMTCSWYTENLESEWKLHYTYRTNGKQTEINCTKEYDVQAFKNQIECCFSEKDFWEFEIYQLQIEGCNRMGCSRFNTTVFTNESIVQLKPVGFLVNENKPREVILTWSFYYALPSVCHVTATSRWGEMERALNFSGVLKASKTFRELQPFTNYTFQTRCLADGSRYWSDVVTASGQTTADAPTVLPRLMGWSYASHPGEKAGNTTSHLCLYIQPLKIPTRQWNGRNLSVVLTVSTTTPSIHDFRNICQSFLADNMTACIDRPFLMDEAYDITLSTENEAGHSNRSRKIIVPADYSAVFPPASIIVEELGEGLFHVSLLNSSSFPELGSSDVKLVWCVGDNELPRDHPPICLSDFGEIPLPSAEYTFSTNISHVTGGRWYFGVKRQDRTGIGDVTWSTCTFTKNKADMGQLVIGSPATTGASVIDVRLLFHYCKMASRPLLYQVMTLRGAGNCSSVAAGDMVRRNVTASPDVKSIAVEVDPSMDHTTCLRMISRDGVSSFSNILHISGRQVKGANSVGKVVGTVIGVVSILVIVVVAVIVICKARSGLQARKTNYRVEIPKIESNVQPTIDHSGFAGHQYNLLEEQSQSSSEESRSASTESVADADLSASSDTASNSGETMEKSDGCVATDAPQRTTRQPFYYGHAEGKLSCSGPTNDVAVQDTEARQPSDRVIEPLAVRTESPFNGYVTDTASPGITHHWPTCDTSNNGLGSNSRSSGTTGSESRAYSNISSYVRSDVMMNVTSHPSLPEDYVRVSTGREPGYVSTLQADGRSRLSEGRDSPAQHLIDRTEDFNTGYVDESDARIKALNPKLPSDDNEWLVPQSAPCDPPSDTNYSAAKTQSHDHQQHLAVFPLPNTSVKSTSNPPVTEFQLSDVNHPTSNNQLTANQGQTATRSADNSQLTEMMLSNDIQVTDSRAADSSQRTQKQSPDNVRPTENQSTDNQGLPGNHSADNQRPTGNQSTEIHRLAVNQYCSMHRHKETDSQGNKRLLQKQSIGNRCLPTSDPTGPDNQSHPSDDPQTRDVTSYIRLSHVSRPLSDDNAGYVSASQAFIDIESRGTTTELNENMNKDELLRTGINVLDKGESAHKGSDHSIVTERQPDLLLCTDHHCMITGSRKQWAVDGADTQHIETTEDNPETEFAVNVNNIPGTPYCIKCAEEPGTQGTTDRQSVGDHNGLVTRGTIGAEMQTSAKNGNSVQSPANLAVQHGHLISKDDMRAAGLSMEYIPFGILVNQDDQKDSAPDYVTASYSDTKQETSVRDDTNFSSLSIKESISPSGGEKEESENTGLDMESQLRLKQDGYASFR